VASLAGIRLKKKRNPTGQIERHILGWALSDHIERLQKSRVVARCWLNRRKQHHLTSTIDRSDDELSIFLSRLLFFSFFIHFVRSQFEYNFFLVSEYKSTKGTSINIGAGGLQLLRLALLCSRLLASAYSFGDERKIGRSSPAVRDV